MKESNQPHKLSHKVSNFNDELKHLSAFQLLHVIKQNISDSYCITDEEGFIIDVNEKYCQMLGYQENELLEKKFTDLLSPEIRPYALMLHHEYIWEHSGENAAEWSYQTKYGEPKALRSTTTRLLTSNQKRYKLEILSPVSSTKLSGSAQEDTIRKIQHQFKNTLHEISGLFHLQAAQLQGEVREAILFSQLRITAIAIAFELLYKSARPEAINLTEYLSRLMGKYEHHFDIQLEHEAIYWQVDKAYALGIILVELLNTIKTGVMAGPKLKIEGKHLESCYRLSLLSDDHFQPLLSSFSRQLIQALGKQLQAKVEIQPYDKEIFRMECKL